MNKLSNPIILVALGLLLGVGTSLGLFWTAAAPLVAEAAKNRVKGHEPMKPEAPWDFWTVEIENLSSELKDAKAALKKREDELQVASQRIAAERTELAKQRQQLEALRTEISNTMISVKEDEMKNVKMLVETYSNVSPKAALTFFRQMDDTMVVKLLALMNKDIRSALFEEMNKQAASDPAIARRGAQLTEKLRLFQSTKSGAP